ncbi:hypothetical protein BCG9842_B1674 [Bacillus cereus G9842]|uniref:Uncharacterized protein n=1 Tax=Bacillus cereus (strain G9842) TaxID=405531 RepID=B7IRI0_BACC2|nr:hypothetical protein BCG9842_B1674 [Bacillus cereus G9842]
MEKTFVNLYKGRGSPFLYIIFIPLFAGRAARKSPIGEG